MRAALFIAAFALTGCRGWTTDKPPVHLNPNMDTQEKLKAYRASDFFEDGRAMRPIQEGTVARGQLREDAHMFQGAVNGAPATTLPAGFVVDEAMLRRGQERYDIYCAPCHDRTGDGQGTVGTRLNVKPPSFHDPRIKSLPIGKIYQAIAVGVNPPNMPSYAVQIDPADRWAIAAYVRALQKARDPAFDPATATGATPPAPAPTPGTPEAPPPNPLNQGQQPASTTTPANAPAAAPAQPAQPAQPAAPAATP